MEKLNNFTSLSILSMLVFCQLISVNGQISTPCTASMMSSFTPCIGYIAGSSRNGGSPTSTCCDSLKSLTSKSMDCVCLIITGNVPLPNFVSQALAIALPKVCGSSVPFQCKSSSVSLPPPGPVLFAPPPPAAISPQSAVSASSIFSPVASSPLTSIASKASALVPAEAPSELLAPTSFPVGDVTPTATPDIRPVSTPSEFASSPSQAPHIMFTFIAFIVLVTM